jgi:hypothetical protein
MAMPSRNISNEPQTICSRSKKDRFTQLSSAFSKAELVKAEWGISSTNRRVRIYKLTAVGVKHLEREISRFERMLEGITRVLARGES